MGLFTEYCRRHNTTYKAKYIAPCCIEETRQQALRLVEVVKAPSLERALLLAKNVVHGSECLDHTMRCRSGGLLSPVREFLPFKESGIRVYEAAKPLTDLIGSHHWEAGGIREDLEQLNELNPQAVVDNQFAERFEQLLWLVAKDNFYLKLIQNPNYYPNAKQQIGKIHEAFQILKDDVCLEIQKHHAAGVASSVLELEAAYDLALGTVEKWQKERAEIVDVYARVPLGKSVLIETGQKALEK